MVDTPREDDIHVLHGPEPRVGLSRESVGKEILNHLRSIPKGVVAMVDAFTDEILFYDQFLRKIVDLAAALRVLGYRGQDTVLAISSENCLDFFVPQFAGLVNCCIAAPVNHAYTPYELEHVLSIGTPKLVFCSREVLPKFAELRKTKLPFIQRIIVLGKAPQKRTPLPEGAEYLEHFIETTLKGQCPNAKTFEAIECDPENTVGLILCSSGTTGLPKGVALSHQCLNVRIAHSRDDDEFESSDPKANQLGMMPFFHGFGNLVTFSMLLNTQTVVSLRRFDEDVFLKTIQDYKIKALSFAPPLALFLAKSEKVRRYDLSCVRSVICGAAPLSKNVEHQVKRRLKLDSIRQAYGLTEMTLIVTKVPPGVHRPGSSGTIATFISGKVRDPETGRSLGPHQVGELCWKGPCRMMGYYKNPQATRDSFTSDGWLRSGDLGYYDEDGYFYVVDRLKELIKYKGFQVAPAELEGVLINHPKIEDAGVVGLPDEAVGERPLAFVVRKAGAEVTEDEIKKYVAGLLSPQKQLSGGVIFVDSIPKNPSGKILRRDLRTLLKKYRSDLGQSRVKSKL